MRNNKGFSIIEVLISVFVLGIGVLAVVALQSTAMTGGTFSRNTTTGSQMASDMLDGIRSNVGTRPDIYNNINTTNCVGLIDPALGDCLQWQTRLAGSGLPNAFGTVAVTVDTPINKLATVSVTVTWGIGTQRTVTFVTVVETWLT